jgi:hypothetical protein
MYLHLYVLSNCKYIQLISRALVEWQSSLDILRLQQLPPARQIMQHCSSEHKPAGERLDKPEPHPASAVAVPPHTAAENTDPVTEGGAENPQRILFASVA